MDRVCLVCRVACNLLYICIANSLMGEEMHLFCIGSTFPASQVPAFPVPALFSFSLGLGIRLYRWPYGREPARWPALIGTRFYIVINYKTHFCFICLQLLACVVYRYGMKEKTMKIRVDAATAAAVLINAKRAFVRENWLLQAPDGKAADFIREKFKPFGERLVKAGKVKTKDIERAHEIFFQHFSKLVLEAK